MDPDSHPSYSMYYDVIDTQSLPFNQGPATSAHQEKSTFLALPMKRNSIAMKTGFIPKWTSQLKEFISKSLPSSNTPDLAVANNESGYLDFKKALLPIICTIQPEDLARQQSSVSEISSAPALGDTVKQFLNHIELILPTDDQWEKMNNLRIHAGSPEASEEGLIKLACYYAHLVQMESKFPFANQEVEMQFEWSEAFWDEKRVVTKCIHYEKASVLFNAASVYSHMGASQRLWSLKGKQTAADYFQRAAGILLYIRDHISKQFKLHLSPSSDLCEKSLTAFAGLMLAQAIECYYEKTVEESGSSQLISKVAAQTSDLYAVCVRSMKTNLSFIDNLCPRSWLLQAKTKWRLYTGIAHFHAETTAPVGKAVSERAARLAIAKELIIKSYCHSTQVGPELEEMVKGHAKGIIDAQVFTDCANFERYQQSQIDPKLLAPLSRPLNVIVNPIEVFVSLKSPESFPLIFHPLTSPKVRNDVLRVLDEYEKFVKVGSTGLRLCLLELDKIAEKRNYLISSLREGSEYQHLLHENQKEASKVMDELSKLQAEENIIKCDELISGLELALNQTENINKDQKKVKKLRKQLEDLKFLYQTQCSDFAPLDWTKEKLSTLFTENTLDPKGSNSGSIKSDDALTTRDQCLQTLKLIEEFEYNIEKLVTNSEGAPTIDDLRKTLFTAKTNFSRILKEKQYLIMDLENCSKVIADQERTATILHEFSKSIATFSRVRNEVQSLLENYDAPMVEEVDSGLDRAIRSKRIIQTYESTSVPRNIYSLDLQANFNPKNIEEWKLNLASPELKHFQVKVPVKTSVEPSKPPLLQRIWSSFNRPSESKLDMFDNDSTMRPYKFSFPPSKDLQLGLLKENARLNDKVLYKYNRSTLPEQETMNRNNSKVSSQYDSVPESAEPMKTYGDQKPIVKTDIQEWLQSQRRLSKQKSKSSVRKPSAKDLFSQEMDPSGVIYMASVAAAAATSAGLTTIQQKVSFTESGKESDNSNVNRITRLRKKMPSWSRQDSAIGKSGSGNSLSDGDALEPASQSVGRKMGHLARKTRMKNSLYQIQNENKLMAEALTGLQSV